MQDEMLGTELEADNPILASLGGEISRYGHEISILVDRLRPVLEPDAPNEPPAGPEEAPIHELHELALALRQLNQRLSRVSNRIRL